VDAELAQFRVLLQAADRIHRPQVDLLRWLMRDRGPVL
jgi:hypothetical protein